MSEANKNVVKVLKAAVGKDNVLTDQESLSFYSMDVYRSIETPIAIGHAPIIKKDGTS